MTERTSRAGDARVYVDGEPENPLAAEVFATIRGRGAKIGTMHRVLAAAPDVLEATYNLAIALRQRTKLPREMGELTIMRTAQLEGGHYEFEAHRGMAISCGLTEAQIDALSDWRNSDLFTPIHRAVLAYVDALHERRDVPAPIYKGLSAHFDPQEIVELTMTAGFYVAVSRLSAGVKMRPEH